jgi:hypothetical protein
MALLQNGYRDFSSGVRIFGATVSNSAYPYALHAKPTGSQRNLTAGEGISSDLAGIPSGYRNEYTWIMPQKAGALAARNQISGAGAFSSAIAGGVNGEATLAGQGDLAGIGALIISLVAALTGSGTITSASADAFLQLAASLAGEGDLAGAASALAHAAAELSGSGTVTGTSTALGELAAEIVVTGDVLNSANVASAVWGALAASNDVAGTMGALLNASGAGGDPWAVTLEGTYTAADLVRIMASVLAGKVSGMETGTPTFRSVDDAADRVTAVTTTDGNRTAVTATGA